MIAHIGIYHGDSELVTLPMFHCNGSGGAYAITATGRTHAVLRAVAGGEIYRLVEQEKVTLACMVPTVLNIILNQPDRRSTASTRACFTVAVRRRPRRSWSGWRWNRGGSSRRSAVTGTAQ